jgi:uncharacterized protein YgbK (DUF1537 family)
LNNFFENNVKESATKARSAIRLNWFAMQMFNSMMDEGSQKATLRGDGAESACPQIVILADDLTGACDSAAAFLGQGRRARVWLKNSGCDAACDADVWSFSTESRNETVAAAEERVGRLSEDLRRLLPSAIFFKKVDSAGRGHFGDEIEASRVASGSDLTICASAFPAAGRCVLHGELRVRDASGTDMKMDLRELFPSNMREQIALIPVGTDVEVKNSVTEAVQSGKQVLLCDAESAADLQRIVRVAQKLPQRPLWAGSAGLSMALAPTLGAGKYESAATEVRRSGRTLILCGTPHPLTQIQMDRLGKESVDSVVARVRCGSTTDDSLRKMFRDAEPVGSLVLTGGDTAAMVLKAFEAEWIDVAGEMEPGVPWGILRGGLADGCVVVTKSGGFGGEHVLVDALHFCRGVTA